MDLDSIDGRFGEAWAGDGANGSHVNLVVARRGSPTAASIATQLGSVASGHAPFLLCLGAGTLVRPATVIRNKTTVDNDRIARLTWGAAQIGLGQGVVDAVADGIIAAEIVDEIVLMAAVWVDPAAVNAVAIKAANREAIRAAIADALAPSHTDHIKHLIANRDSLTNRFDDAQECST